MSIPRPVLLASLQAEPVAGNDSYWPKGFVDEFIAELAASLEAGSDGGFEFATLKEMCRRAAVEITADLFADPRGALSEEAGQQAAFEARLQATWGRGLDLADLVICQAYEAGSWVNDLLRPAAAARQDQKFEALIRLHGKAVMTAREVLVLLRRGYSSGAFARWRTLHEVRVVLLVLADGDEELIRRYLAHRDVEALKWQKEYEAAWETVGHEPPDWTGDEREQAQAELVIEFDRAFLQDYGWAAPLFGGRAPPFKELEQRVNLDPMRGYYRLASQGVHANAKGITWNIQTLADIDVVLAGPSDAGLVDPAQCALLALADATNVLMGYAAGELSSSADKAILNQGMLLVRHRVIGLLMDHAIQVLVDVGEQQEAEQEARAELAGRATAILAEGAPMTAEDLADALEVDPDAVEDALDAAVTRGEVLHETRYRAGSATEE